MILTKDQIQAQLADALPRYEILRWIGAGGMAQVFLARNRTTGALFAIKVLNTSPASLSFPATPGMSDLAEDKAIVSRFIQEARTVASLAGHPNIVPVFDVLHENGLNFLIMQYVEGEDLSNYLVTHKKFGPDEAVDIVRQVADALRWASANGVVHRDLKPSNLYWNRASGRVMVLDFGIAKAKDAPSLTRQGERFGTPYYMSPEQIRGDECDVRSDLYSLGIVFFELLTGSKPFDGESNWTIQKGHLEAPPPDLKEFDPKELDPTLASKLSPILNKLLTKKAIDRYQSPTELIEALAVFDQPPPKPPAPLPAPPPPPYLKPLLVGLGTLLFGVVLFWVTAVQDRAGL